MTDVLTGLLTTLVDGDLDEQGEAMLNDIYNISTANFSQMTPQEWAAATAPSKLNGSWITSKKSRINFSY
jgi:hypothetical protein